MKEGCRALVPRGYCPQHRGTRKGRGEPRAGTWGKARAYQLREFPNCARCGQPAREVDHVVPLADGGTDHPANYQSLCHTCHAIKTAMENRERTRKRVT